MFDCQEDKLINDIIKQVVVENKLIINIGKNKISGIMNLLIPFDINDLVFYVKNFVNFLLFYK